MKLLVAILLALLFTSCSFTLRLGAETVYKTDEDAESVECPKPESQETVTK